MKTPQQTLEFLLEDRIKLATVSGVGTTKPNLIEHFDRNIPDFELISSKSYQVFPNLGNRETIITEMGVGNFGNAVGLKNPGMDQGYRDLIELRERHDLRCYLNVSLSADSIEGFITLVRKFWDVADLLELNFSCPHAKKGFGASIGSSAEIVREYVHHIRKETRALIFPKLTPNVDNIGEIAMAALEEGADGISAINTVGPEVFIEPHTGKPILYNPNGHKGGKSGEWIREIAIEKVREIRNEVGDEVPIIGMGGMTTGGDVKRMRDAGANVIGIGSVLARVSVESRPLYIAALKKDAEKGTKTSHFVVSDKRQAEYKPYKISRIIEKGEDLRVLELEGRVNYESSQFAFLWVPDVGEKPFSIANGDPLTFVIRKREYDPEKNKGLVTHALFQKEEGDEIMIRGVYGAAAPISHKSNAYIIAGGTGIAVVPKLAEKLHNPGKQVVVYYGMTSDQEVLRKEIQKYALFLPVEDTGVKGRVLDAMQVALDETNLEDSCFYNIGPVPLMEKAMEKQADLGADPKDIFASLETNNMCGTGICGECECGGRLTCKEGTFFSLDYLKKKKIELETLK